MFLKAIGRSTLLFAFAFASLQATDTFAKNTEKTIDYKEGETQLEGFLVTPAKKSGKLPAVIIVHEWDGLGDYVKRRARMVADLGYVAFDADIYGKGIRASTPEESGKLATKYKSDRKLLRARAQAAFDYVSKLPNVDTSRIAVMGYCFGGTTALELARSGAPLAGTVSFHGALATPHVEDAKNIKGKVLVLHGADDPSIPAAEIAAFQDEMRKANVDWEFVSYGGAVHAFTNDAHAYKPGAMFGYNEHADKRSWAAMKDFFGEIFKK